MFFYNSIPYQSLFLLLFIFVYYLDFSSTQHDSSPYYPFKVGDEEFVGALNKKTDGQTADISTLLDCSELPNSSRACGVLNESENNVTINIEWDRFFLI